MDNLCTILVNSCDNYEDAWNPFFKLIKKYWKDRKYPIVLNTETKSYDFEDLKIKTFSLYKNRDLSRVTWSHRMIETLNKIDSKYIIFMLDDFYLMDYVDNSKIDEIINWLENDTNIAVFSFNVVEKNDYNDVDNNKYYGYALRNKNGPYRFNCQAAIWRKDILIKTFRKHESPWEWELIGNKRSERFNQEFYTVVDKKDMIFKYDCENVGIVRGKWRLPETKIFFDKEGIYIDYSIRNDQNHESVGKNLFKSIKTKFNRIKSLI
ncbi:MAG: hypothetical protein RR623_05265 [Bacilli bacterium]